MVLVFAIEVVKFFVTPVPKIKPAWLLKTTTHRFYGPWHLPYTSM